MKTAKEALLNRLHNNQEEFLNEVEHYDNIHKVINSSYEIVMKEDIVSLFECNNDLLTEEQCAALLKFKDPLNVLYDAWMDNDCSHMEMLRDTVVERADEAVKEIISRLKGFER